MNEQDAAVLKAYLCDGLSHRKIQEVILKLEAPVRGGGFEAMRILQRYSITGADKASLNNVVFDPERFEAAGNVKNYLKTFASSLTELPEPAISKNPRIDWQLSALAGEFFVAAELLRRGYQTSVTFGNAKAIDLLACHPKNERVFKVQVKTLRKMNYFLISKERICADHIYVFALLNEPGQAVHYFVVPGYVLIDEAEQFGKDFQHPTMPGIHPKRLQPFADAWHYFD